MRIKVTIQNIGIQEPNVQTWESKGTICKHRLHVPLSGRAIYHGMQDDILLESGYYYIMPNSFSKQLQKLPDSNYRHLYMDFHTLPVLKGNKVLRMENLDDIFVFHLMQSIQTLVEEYGKKTGKDTIPRSQQELLAQMEGILEVIINRLADNNLIQIIQDDRIMQAFSYIEQHYSENISVQDIADFIYVSSSSLNRMFEKHAGMSPYQYLTECRIQKACSQMRGSKSITDVAVECGFQSLNSFRIAFKKSVGCTPTEYIKK